MKLIKNILIYSVLTLGVFILNACFDDPGSDAILRTKFVSFGAQDGNLEIVEADLTDTLLIEISYAQSSDVEVTYEVEVDGAIEGVDFEVDAPNPIVIPAGEYSVKVPVNVTDNTTFDGEDPRTFTITITEVSASGVGINGVTSATITIADDDCLLVTDDYLGTFSCNEPGYGDYDVTITEGDQENRFVITNFWDYAGVTIYVDFDSESNTVTVPDQGIALTQGGVQLRVEGEGKYAACTGTFFYNYIVYNPNTSAILDDNTHTYTP